jgi:hypothetical protein
MLTKTSRIFGSVLIALSLVIIPNIAAAAPTAGTGQGLEISPPLVDIKTDPGKVVTTQIKVRNVTQSSLLVKAQFEDFVANDESGTPKILLNSSEKSPYSIKDWLEAPASITLAPGQREPINVTINVPANASPGGHYGVVRFTGTPPEIADTGVSLSASVGTLMLVNVSGNVNESAKVAQIYTSQNNKQSGFFKRGPVLITTRVQNTGNVHFKPKGTLQITNTFGKTVKVVQFNYTNSNVLPGSIRKFQNLFDKQYMLGRYKVSVDVVYGSNNQIASGSTTFWVIPYNLILLIVLGIVAIVFGLKRYNKHIISKAGKQGGHGSGKKKGPRS